MDRRQFIKSMAAYSALLSVPVLSNRLFEPNLSSDLTDLSASDLSAAIGIPPFPIIDLLMEKLSCPPLIC